MKQYEVNISENAAIDLETIYQNTFDLTKSEIIAKKQCNILMDAINSLKQFPNRIKKVAKIQLDGEEIHCMPVGKYSVLFIKKNENVFVLDVLYGAGEAIQKVFMKD